MALSSNARFPGDVGPTNLSLDRPGGEDIPNKRSDAFKQIMIKSRVRWILADLRKNTKKMLNRDLQERSQSVPAHRHNSHHAYHQPGHLKGSYIS